MNAIRQIVKSKNGVVSVKLPDNFVAEKYEVIVLPLEEKYSKNDGLGNFLNSLPETESDLVMEEIVSLVKSVRAESNAKN